jgi:hypothetical protein
LATSQISAPVTPTTGSSVGKSAATTSFTDIENLKAILGRYISNLIDIQNSVEASLQKAGSFQSVGTKQLPNSTDITTTAYTADYSSGTLASKYSECNLNQVSASPTMDSSGTNLSFKAEPWEFNPQLPTLPPNTGNPDPIDDVAQVSIQDFTSLITERNQVILNQQHKLDLARYSADQDLLLLNEITQGITNALAILQQLNQLYSDPNCSADITDLNNSAQAAAQGEQNSELIQSSVSTTSVQQNSLTSGVFNPYPDSTWLQFLKPVTLLSEVNNAVTDAPLPNLVRALGKVVEHPNQLNNTSLTLSQIWFVAAVVFQGTLVPLDLVTTPAGAVAGPGYYVKNNLYLTPTCKASFLSFVSFIQSYFNGNVIVRVTEAFPPSSRHNSKISFLDESKGIYTYLGPHYTGNAMDVVLEFANQVGSLQSNRPLAVLNDTIRAQMADIVSSYKAVRPTDWFYIKDEYNGSSQHKTGPHLHMNLVDPQYAITNNAPKIGFAKENINIYAQLPASIRSQITNWSKIKFQKYAGTLLSTTNTTQAIEQLGLFT